MAASANKLTGRAAALARRQAQSNGGKAGLSRTSSSHHGGQATGASTARPAAAPPRARTPSPSPSAPAGSSRAAARARRAAMSDKGRASIQTKDRRRADAMDGQPPRSAPQPVRTGAGDKGDCSCGCKDGKREDAPRAASPRPAARKGGKAPRRPQVDASQMASGRLLAKARRQALSGRGKAALNGSGGNPGPAQVLRQARPNANSRDIAKSVRADRANRGGRGQPRTRPSGRDRRNGGSGQGSTAPSKVGESETSHGQSVTGTLVGRSRRVTGDEPSTCRSVTGTEYLGADIFREFCDTDLPGGPRKVGVSHTGAGRGVTGTEVGRSERVTGDEPGTCKRVTGTEYVSSEQAQSWCGITPEPRASHVGLAPTMKNLGVTGIQVGRSNQVTGNEPGSERTLTGTQYTHPSEVPSQAKGGPRAEVPSKVGTTQTLSGGPVTGTLVGRSTRVTGDEPGSCRAVTGDEYIGEEQYRGFCEKTPAPQDAKVGQTETLLGQRVSGTLTGRSGKVTGDEPGTCKSITGTPYASSEQYESYCEPEQSREAASRTRQYRQTPGPAMTGLQPGIGGKLTGAARGACEPLTGTPYVGTDQFQEACEVEPAHPGSSDFPQSLDGSPWMSFSITSPARAAQVARERHGVTGTSYENGSVTGTFALGQGKITGTEDFRFGQKSREVPQQAAVAPGAAPAPTSRVTGEGMTEGLRITGDDWGRNDQVTGTEGLSSTRRNPTRRGGPMSAMPAPKRNEEVAAPTSPVTGGSGNTEKGALITVSGGARG